ncbi:883_t:CDS:2 [Diversispora eburnea]|uniref:883_t:CDS:1 n=1 Tax=Diversispora eburnea TaxID=1213867 RepID=A0A9N9FZC3_9GLOM|nr:883_t:CDS:2 [Diversispora eburnea]
MHQSQKFPPGVVVRSLNIPLPKPKQVRAVKVTRTLQEFGLELQKAIKALLEIKKRVDKHEYELKIKLKKISSGI